MALAWFGCPYKVNTTDPNNPFRYCAMDDFTAQILADGGAWREGEILGDYALVKVRASAATLTAINAAPGMLRVPNHFDLSDTLGDLTAPQRTAILNFALARGYTQAQIDAALPANWQNVTLGQVLRFLSSRWRRPSDIVGGATVFESVDWAGGAPESVDVVAANVQ